MERQKIVMSLGLLMAAAMIFWSSAAGAVQIVIDTNNLDERTAASVLEAEKQAKKIAEDRVVAEKKAFSPDRLEVWADLGQKVGKAIAATCREIGVEVNNFIKTPVGMITMGIILWKVIGLELWSIIGGTLVWVVITAILLWSYRYFHMRERVSGAKGEKPVYVERYSFKSNDAKGLSVTCHAGFFAIITVTCLLIVF